MDAFITCGEGFGGDNESSDLREEDIVDDCESDVNAMISTDDETRFFRLAISIQPMRTATHMMISEIRLVISSFDIFQSYPVNAS
jgi:hypothetical protein